MAKEAASPNKSAFIRDYLRNHPDARERDVNEAWQAAGQTDKIGADLISKVKSRRLTEGKTKDKGKAKAGSPKVAEAKEQVTTRTVTQVTPAQVVPSSTLEDVEANIDRLLFQIMGIEGLADVEHALRRARRLVVRKHEG